MVCPKCKEDGVLSDAGIVRSIPFYYCRTCKEEITLEQVLPSKDPLLDNNFSFEPFYYFDIKTQ